jgi:flagellar assembly factor FliW
VKIQTSRFGEIDVEESNIFEMKNAILGFHHLNKFTMMNHGEGSPLHWLQSLDDGSIAFVVVNPFIIKPDYEPEIDDRALEMLEIGRAEEIDIMVILTVRSEPVKITANLRAPLVMNKQKKLASQIVLDDEQYPVQYGIT